MQDLTSLLKRLEVPTGMVDVVLDTDTYNEIDDQFALAYLLRSPEKLRAQAIYAAPFFNHRSTSPADGMEKSYQEIHKVVDLVGAPEMKNRIFRGSTAYLPDEKTPVESPAARDLVERALAHSPENPLYVVAIGAITNVASALLMEPRIVDRVVIVWLGGHAFEWPDTNEFNMMQDIAAARVIFGSGAAVVQLPCNGVVSAFYTNRQELEYYLYDKNPLSDYLARNTVSYMGDPNRLWSKVIWDVTAVAWVLGDFMADRLAPAPIPQYDFHYSFDPNRHPIRYVWSVWRDKLYADLFAKLTR